MSFIIVNKETIALLNEGSKDGSVINAVPDGQGRFVIDADILTDEKNWGHAFEYLTKCDIVELDKSEFPYNNIKE